jgi:hypothetical protein
LTLPSGTLKFTRASPDIGKLDRPARMPATDQPSRPCTSTAVNLTLPRPRRVSLGSGAAGVAGSEGSTMRASARESMRASVQSQTRLALACGSA